MARILPLSLFLGAVFLSGCAVLFGPASCPRGFKPCFDSESLPTGWRLKDGVFFFDGSPDGDPLKSARVYRDFELWADWRLLTRGGDAGIYLRGAPQVQVWDASVWKVGSGGLYNNQENPSQPTAIADNPIGEWNRFHIVMRGDKVSVTLNGVPVVEEVTLENFWDRSKPVPEAGPLEIHGHDAPVEWRNVYIRELPSEKKGNAT